MPTTVDKIRRALEKRDGIAEDEMRVLADSYRTQVQEVNQRLDDAVMLLRKGLRSEAIQRVEMTPNALDAAADMEFPEWDEWNEILQFMGIPLPPKLNQDYVAQINEAIIESLPLDALLRRHRRLAIAKAPLAVRLRTLRQIARVDSSNSVWQDDVEKWEKVRLSQIDRELKHALEQEDSAYLYQLNQELTAGNWRVAPSSRLVDQCSFAAEAHVRQSQETELAALAPQINAAFEQRDEAEARRLRAHWQAVRAKHKVSVPAHLETSVAAAMQWLEDLDRQAVMESERQQAMATLESKLQAHSPIEDVQAAYDQASRFGEPLPEDLTHRVEELANQPAKQAKRKVMLIAGGVAAVVLVAIVGVVMFLASSGKQTAQQETVDQMTQFISAEQYDAAVNYYHSVLSTDPEVAQLPKMVAMQATAKKAVEKEASRQELFDKLIAQASNDDPALIDEILLPQLDELAASPGEQARVDDLRKRKEAYRAGEAMRQSDEMIGKIAELQRQFGELSRRGSSAANRQAIAQLLSSIVRLPNQFPLGSDEARAKQETLRSQVDSTLKRMKDESMVSQQRDDAIDSLLNSRSLEVYSDRLRDFSTQSVSRTNFVEFRTVIDEEDHWFNVERTNAWLDALATKLNDGVTSTEASGLIESAEKIQALAYPNPVLAAMPDFIETMKEIVGRRVILSGAFGLISKHPLSRLVTLPIPDAESPSGTTSHLIYKTFAEQNADRMSRAGSIGVDVVSDPLGGVRNRAFQGPLPKVVEEPMRSISQVVDQKSKQAIGFDTKWEQTFLIQVSEVMKRKELDGIIKEWLIYYLLDAATRGSEDLKQMIPLTMRALVRRSSVREQWHQSRPTNYDLNPELRKVIMAELNVAYRRFANPLSEYEKVASERLKWVGFLSKSAGGQIEYHLRGGTPEADGTLYVVAAAREGDAETSFFPVGKVQQGHVQLTPNPVHQVPGRPLFLFPY
ncbi:hypothetical protein Mal15_36140 [Stieleria maiorica]|uniref:Uncharacterized protein n=1 Tax=Stieleria maiorica TaxID=2795974 RepID=A0A5B9MGC3_9BACT|nr:hypothetical protein [Stieleria maiorica]QEF99549.1 hypothetical protein Mal15_36140 [Stieleria maiorica]